MTDNPCLIRARFETAHMSLEALRGKSLLSLLTFEFIS